MKLYKLTIERKMYGENKGQYYGTISFDNEHGKVDIHLTEEHCQRMFEVVADGIIDTAKEAASNLTCSVLEHKQSLETLPTTGDER